MPLNKTKTLIHEEKVKMNWNQNADFTRKKIAFIDWVLKCNSVYLIFFFIISI